MPFLFDDIIFGPVSSRRLGRSLGVNILPLKKKLCTYNCVYCECGWTRNTSESPNQLPTRQEVILALEAKLSAMAGAGNLPDAITFAGNGEPTLHPEFEGIATDTMKLRDSYAPDSKMVILSNATTLHKEKILDVLTRFDLNILKLDCGTEEMFQLMNDPAPGLSLENITRQLTEFNGHVILQSMFTRGHHNGKQIDNTTLRELEAWLERVNRIQPKRVMIYSLDREPPEKSLEKVSHKELETIGQKVRKLGIEADIY